VSASGPTNLRAKRMTYSRLTKLTANDWKVAESPVAARRRLSGSRIGDLYDDDSDGHLRRPHVGDSNSDPRPRV